MTFEYHTHLEYIEAKRKFNEDGWLVKDLGYVSDIIGYRLIVERK